MKMYFYEADSTTCTTLEFIKDMIYDNDLTEKEVYKAVRSVGEGLMYCTQYGEVGEVGQGCGKTCKYYEPRNGKNGRCRFSGYCYSHGEKVLIKL